MGFGGVEFWHHKDQVPYPEAMATMAQRVALIQNKQASEVVWFLEHPPLYTAGPRSQEHHLIDPKSLPVYPTARGGQYTYHGPGQRVGYVMLDLKQRTQDLRHFMGQLEAWLMAALRHFNICAERRVGRVGLWVDTPLGEAKIAAFGVKTQKWVTSHGFALNMCPDLQAFQGIVPCGLEGFGVTSVQQLAGPCGVADLDQTLKQTFSEFFPLRKSSSSDP